MADGKEDEKKTFQRTLLTGTSHVIVKLAHYLKIPPRTLFFAQGLATILGALTQVGVTLWMLGNIDGICTDDQPNGFTCPNGETVYSSSIIWGLIGPARLYSVGKIYSGLVRRPTSLSAMVLHLCFAAESWSILLVPT